MNTLGMRVRVLVVSSLMMGCTIGFAQGMSGRGGASAQAQSRAAGGQRLLQHDRLSTHSMDRLHDRDRLRDQDRDRDQDRIYGSQLMTASERSQYEQRLHSLATEQERVQFRMEHQHEMQLRAEQRGVTLSPEPTQAQLRTQEQQRQQERQQIYGYSMMSPAEVGRYEQQMRNARTEQERARIRSEHRNLIQERAHERGEAAPK